MTTSCEFLFIFPLDEPTNQLIKFDRFIFYLGNRIRHLVSIKHLN